MFIDDYEGGVVTKNVRASVHTENVGVDFWDRNLRVQVAEVCSIPVNTSDSQRHYQVNQSGTPTLGRANTRVR